MDFSKLNVQAVSAGPGEHALFMVFNINKEKESEDKVKTLAGKFSGLLRSMKNRFPDLKVSGVMGFGKEAWLRIFPDAGIPKELEIYQEIKGDKFTAPSTPADLFFHLRAERGLYI